MNFKQFRQPANGHSRTALAGGRIVGGRGFCLMSKIGQGAIASSGATARRGLATGESQWTSPADNGEERIVRHEHRAVLPCNPFETLFDYRIAPVTLYFR